VAVAATSWWAAASAQTRLTNRACPSICSSLQSKSRSGGPAKSTYIRTVSAPYRSTMVAGATTFPQRFDIFRPSGPFTMPCVTSLVTGSSVGTRPRIFIHRLQKRK